jgi:hypothetical protein
VPGENIVQLNFESLALAHLATDKDLYGEVMRRTERIDGRIYSGINTKASDVVVEFA